MSNNFVTKEKMQIILWQNVRKKCQQDKVDIMKLSETIEISYEYLRDLLSINGRKNASLYTIYKVAKAIEISPDELFRNVL